MIPTVSDQEQLSLLPSAEDVRFYEEHGWWISPPILSAEDIEDAWFGLQRYYAGERDASLLMETGTDWTEDRGNVLRQNDYVSLQITNLRKLAHNPLIAASAAKLARTSEIRLFHDQLIYKPQQISASDATVGWHTDIAYWETCSSRDLLTAWIPFQDCTEQMGPMLVIDGSHKWEGNDRLKFFHESDLKTIASRIKQGGSKMEIIPMTLKCGQVSFHHCRTIHGSYPNQSDRPRVALAVHMQDFSNRFVRSYREDGKQASHINDFLCRKNADGDPDYSDPEVFPVLWPSEG